MVHHTPHTTCDAWHRRSTHRVFAHVEADIHIDELEKPPVLLPVELHNQTASFVVELLSEAALAVKTWLLLQT